ncbi:MAG: hypothetical protein IPL60_07615 [Ardenticatenia bacterium]|nr:hypothetical protein [Ardenticatenia bacterium]
MNRCYLDLQGLVWLGGPDRLAFLERMGTARLADLGPWQGRATVLTSDEGRAVDLLACHAGPDGAALICSSRAAAPLVAAQLKQYVLYSDKVTVTDATEQVAVLRLTGADAAAIAGGVSGIDLADLVPGDWRAAGEGAGEIWLLRHPQGSGLDGWDLVVPRPAATGIAERAVAAGAALSRAGDYDAERVPLLLPMRGAEIDGSANPLELGLVGLVDFAKGCYIGQEVIARLHNYEKVQRALRTVRSTEPLVAGAPWPPLEAGERPGGRARRGRVCTVVRAPDGRGWLATVLAPLGADAA